MDWGALHTQAAPYVPRVDHELDTQNFERFDEDMNMNSPGEGRNNGQGVSRLLLFSCHAGSRGWNAGGLRLAMLCPMTDGLLVPQSGVCLVCSQCAFVLSMLVALLRL